VQGSVHLQKKVNHDAHTFGLGRRVVDVSANKEIDAIAREKTFDDCLWKGQVGGSSDQHFDTTARDGTERGAER
jgi:hypothetical protein